MGTITTLDEALLHLRAYTDRCKELQRDWAKAIEHLQAAEEKYLFMEQECIRVKHLRDWDLVTIEDYRDRLHIARLRMEAIQLENEQLRAQLRTAETGPSEPGVSHKRPREASTDNPSAT